MATGPERKRIHRIMECEPRNVAAGETEVIDLRGVAGFTVLLGSGASATWERVADIDGTAIAGTSPVSVVDEQFIPADWPYVKLSATGGVITWCYVGVGGAQPAAE